MTLSFHIFCLFRNLIHLFNNLLNCDFASKYNAPKSWLLTVTCGEELSFWPIITPNIYPVLSYLICKRTDWMRANPLQRDQALLKRTRSESSLVSLVSCYSCFSLLLSPLHLPMSKLDRVFLVKLLSTLFWSVLLFYVPYTPTCTDVYFPRCCWPQVSLKGYIFWKQHFFYDLGCSFGSLVRQNAYKLLNKSVHAFPHPHPPPIRA